MSSDDETLETLENENLVDENDCLYLSERQLEEIFDYYKNILRKIDEIHKDFQKKQCEDKLLVATNLYQKLIQTKRFVPKIHD